jgi:hypothetical protein
MKKSPNTNIKVTSKPLIALVLLASLQLLTLGTALAFQSKDVSPQSQEPIQQKRRLGLEFNYSVIHKAWISIHIFEQYTSRSNTNGSPFCRNRSGQESKEEIRFNSESCKMEQSPKSS